MQKTPRTTWDEMIGDQVLTAGRLPKRLYAETEVSVPHQVQQGKSPHSSAGSLVQTHTWAEVTRLHGQWRLERPS